MINDGPFFCSPGSLESGGEREEQKYCAIAEDLITEITPFVSLLVLNKLARDPSPIEEPFEEKIEAAVLFADLAGFTRVAEKMNAEGLSGVEKLSGILNEYFERLVEFLDLHGGIVTSFTGDGVAALWQAADVDLSETVFRATNCALQIQKRMQDFPSFGETRLSMRIGVAAGNVCHRVVGGENHQWLSTVTGECVNHCVRAAQIALPGRVAIAPMTWPFVAKRIEGTVQSRGCVFVESISHAPDPVSVCHPSLSCNAAQALLQFVPAAVLRGLHASGSAWLPEFRQVTVVFINIPDFRMEEPDSLVRTHCVTRMMQRELHRFGGTVDALLMEFGGFALVAALGLPPFSHEDDPIRAVRAAMAIRDELRNVGITAQIGVTTGSLFCGVIGGSVRKAYTMIGDTVNLSQRLMSYADDDLLCDSLTEWASKNHIRFKFLGKIPVEGKEEMVETYRPLCELTSSEPKLEEIVGRREERQLLKSMLEKLLQDRTGGLILIEGDAGIGKSTLVADFMKAARDCNVCTLFGMGDSIERSKSYAAWETVFASLLKIEPELERDERDEYVSRRLERFSSIHRILPVLNTVFSTNFDETEITEGMNPQSRSEAANNALIDLLEVHSRNSPLVVVLDDCHWLDSASFMLAGEVHRRMPNVLLIMLARGTGAANLSDWSKMRTRDRAVHLFLESLSREESELLVCRRLGVEGLPRAVSRLIHEKAEGHPLFCEQLAYALRDKMYLIEENGECRLSPYAGELKEIAFPETVHGVVRERLDRMEETARMLLKAASVIGRAFPLDLLCAMHATAVGKTELANVIDDLAVGNFVSRVETGNDRSIWQFKHAIVQEVCYRLLTERQKAKLHGRVARELEKMGGENLPQQYSVLAHHWTVAGDTEKAIHYLSLAGEQALRRFANREAVWFLQAAVENTKTLKRDSLKLGKWHRQIGEAYFRMGQMEQGREHLRTAVAALGFPVPAPAALKLMRLPMAACRQTWNRIFGVGFRKGNTSREAHLEAMRAYAMLGEIGFFTNDILATVFSCVHGLNIAEASGEPSSLAEPYASMMIAGASVPFKPLGRLYMGLTKRSMESLTRLVDQGYPLAMMAMYLGGIGGWREAGEYLARAESMYSRYGNMRRLEEALTIRFYNLQHQGLITAARKTTEEMSRSVRLRGDPQTTGWARLMHAQSVLPVEGGEAALRALGLDATAHDTLTRVAHPTIRGVCQLRAGNFAQARAAADEALNLLRGNPPVAFSLSLSVSYLAEVYVCLLEDALCRGVEVDRDLVRDLRKALRITERFARIFTIGRPRVELWKGVVACVTGRKSAAQRHWTCSLLWAEKLGMAHDVGLIKFHRGRLGQGPQREALLLDSVHIFKNIGAHFDQARAEEVLNRDTTSFLWDHEVNSIRRK